MFPTCLCFPNSDCYSTTQVSISSTTTASTAPVTPRTSRPGVRSLPPNVQRSFSDSFAPCVIAEMGCSASPWLNLDVDTVQGYVNLVYTGHEYTVEHGDGFHASVCPCTRYPFVKHSACLKANNRIMSFRNNIGNTALENVQSYLTRYTQDQTESYVRSALIYYGEIPFLYRVFNPTNVRATKEKGGYKVVSALYRPKYTQHSHSWR